MCACVFVAMKLKIYFIKFLHCLFITPWQMDFGGYSSLHCLVLQKDECSREVREAICVSVCEVWEEVDQGQ